MDGKYFALPYFVWHAIVRDGTHHFVVWFLGRISNTKLYPHPQNQYLGNI